MSALKHYNLTGNACLNNASKLGAKMARSSKKNLLKSLRRTFTKVQQKREPILETIRHFRSFSKKTAVQRIFQKMGDRDLTRSHLLETRTKWLRIDLALRWRADGNLPTLTWIT